MKTLLNFLFAVISMGLSAQAGALDAAFTPGTGANNVVFSIAGYSDDKILIAGAFTSFDGSSANRIARLNPGGTLDTTFDSGTGANNTINAVAVQSDGKIIIGGDFTSYNGASKNYIARLNADGSLDTSFTGTGTDSPVHTIAIQSDDKIIIGGEFTSYSGVARSYLARLNANGNLDTAFTGSANSIIYASAIQPDSRILIGGLFTSYGGTGRNRIARTNATGSLHTSFDPGTGATSVVQTVAVQTDGKILIGGNFFNYNGVSTRYLARLNANGSLDTSFTQGTGPNGDIFKILLQADGKILIAGSFGNYNGITRSSIARLNTNGSLDLDFNPGTGAVNDGQLGNVYAIALQADGKIIIGGNFTSYNGNSRNRIARILSQAPTLDSKDLNNKAVKIYPNPVTSIINFTQKSNVKIYNTLGQIATEQKRVNNLNISKLLKGVYIVILSDDYGKEILKSKIIKE